jgi:hypothetical protein
MRLLPAVLVLSGLLASGCNCGEAGPPDSGAPPLGLGELELAIVEYHGDIELLQTDGGSAPLVVRSQSGTLPPVALRWSPQGTRLAYADGALGYLREADGGVAALGRQHGGHYREGSTTRVEWSPDGTRLALDGVDDASDATSVFIAATDGGEPDFVGWAWRWAWEPGGRGLLYTDYDSTAQAMATFRYDLATRDAGLYLAAELLDASPRGALVFQRVQPAPDGGDEVAVVLRWPDGGTSALLPPGTVEAVDSPTAVSLSPYADDAVLVVRKLPQGPSQVLRASASGGVRVLMEAAGPELLPTCWRFVPGGEYLSYVSLGSVSRVVLLARDGGQLELDTGRLDAAEGLGCLDWRRRP